MMDSYDLQNTLQHERLDAYAVAVALDGASAPSPPKDIHEGVPALGQLVGPGPAHHQVQVVRKPAGVKRARFTRYEAPRASPKGTMSPISFSSVRSRRAVARLVPVIER